MSIGSTGTRSSTSSNDSGQPAADKVHQVLEEYQAAASATASAGGSSRTTLRRSQSSLRNPAKTTTARSLKKSVSFDERKKKIIPIENIQSIPKRELHRRWMSETDFAKIRHETYSTLQLLDLGRMPARDGIDGGAGSCGNNKRSARGLERLTEVGMYKYRIQHQHAVFAVLRAQHQQQQHQRLQQQVWYNAASPENVEGAIARAYREETMQAVREAIQLAQDDQKIAEQEYRKHCLDLEAIRKLQHEQLARQIQLDKKTLLNQLIMKPALRLSRSLSLRNSMAPQA